MSELAKLLWKDFLEKDDRTSPAEYPDMAIITFDEFSTALASAELLGKIEGARELLGLLEKTSAHLLKNAKVMRESFGLEFVARVREYTSSHMRECASAVGLYERLASLQPE